ncbi:MAG: glycosyltransferase family 2 protein [Candidatus Aenigmarchaeota archaeon]|nr:glycosyltransferase family 2 protein [Candidatus Aenigmarchaeota archaeon]
MFDIIINLIVVILTVFISNVFLITLFLKREGLFHDPKPKEYPDITIAVPAYNEEKNISRTLKCLLNLNYPKKINIIVINDASKDKTADVVRKFPVKLIDKKKNEGKAKALNDALKITKTKIFGFIDAETFMDKNALLYMVGYLDKKNVAAVTPSIYVMNPKNLIENLQNIEYAFSMMTKKLLTFLSCLYMTPGCAIYKTDILKKVGGFDTNNISEDMEIGLKLNSFGYVVEDSLNAKVWTVAPDTIKKLLKQRIRWFRGTMHNLRKYKSMFGKSDIGLFAMPIILVAGMFTMLSYLFFLGLNIFNFVLNFFAFSLASVLSGFTVSTASIPVAQNILVTFAVFLLGVFVLNIYFSQKISGLPLFRNIKELLIFLLFYSPILSLALIISIIKTITRREMKW